LIELPLNGPAEDGMCSTPYGPVRRLRFHAEVQGSPLFWERPFESVGSSNPKWTALMPV
jgi:hypothetical protein